MMTRNDRKNLAVLAILTVSLVMTMIIIMTGGC